MPPHKRFRYRIIQGEAATEQGNIPNVVWRGDNPQEFIPPNRLLAYTEQPPFVLEELTENCWIHREWSEVGMKPFETEPIEPLPSPSKL